MKNITTAKILLALGVFVAVFSLSSCFSYKSSPFYDSEWIMKNMDEAGNEYFHQIFFKKNKEVTIQSYYLNSPQQVVWTGNFSMNSKKIKFDIKNCAQFENGQFSFYVNRTNIIKYFAGEYLYSVSNANNEYRMELIRPQNFFYGKNLDFMGQKMETWTRIEKEVEEVAEE